MPTKLPRVMATVPKEVYKRLRGRAKRDKTSMSKIIVLAILALLATGCNRKEDAPPPSSVIMPPGQPPPPPDPCNRGGTIMISNNGGISSMHTLTVPIHNLMPSCGDTINVYFSNPGQNNWFPVPEAPTAQPNWYTIGVGSVTFHNGSYVQQDWEFQATEK